MTEPIVEKPVAPAGQTIDGMVPAPDGLFEATTAEAGLELEVRSQWSYARRRFLRHRLAMAGLLGLVVVFSAGALAPYIAPYAVDHIDLTKSFAPPSWKHIFGTDEIGHDQFSRVIYGIRTSEEVGVFVAIVSSLFGMTVGAVAGYYGGWTDNILMRVTDLVLTLPALAVLLTAAALWGGGAWVAESLALQAASQSSAASTVAPRSARSRSSVSRWASTAGAISRMSSGSTNDRPSSIAAAWPAR